MHLHHLVPRAHGGGHDPENLVTLCGACHRLWHEQGGDLVGLLIPVATAGDLQAGDQVREPVPPYRVVLAARRHGGERRPRPQGALRHSTLRERGQLAPLSLSAVFRSRIYSRILAVSVSNSFQHLLSSL